MGFQACERVVNTWRHFFPLVPTSFSGIFCILQFRIFLHVLSSSFCMFSRVVSGSYPFLFVFDPLVMRCLRLYVHMCTASQHVGKHRSETLANEFVVMFHAKSASSLR